MPHIDEIETKILDKKTMMDYKHHLLKLMIDLDNNQNEFLPTALKHKKVTEKDLIKQIKSVDLFIEEVYETQGFFVGSFHKTKDNNLIAYLIIVFYEEYDTKYAFIKELYVDPYYRRIHTGKLLLEIAFEEIKKHPFNPKVINLGVLSENKIPQKIYDKFGFKTYSQTMYLEL